jgi:hypothetical protein
LKTKVISSITTNKRTQRLSFTFLKNQGMAIAIGDSFTAKFPLELCLHQENRSLGDLIMETGNVN